jgi:ectoine hydroxylase-related dioxygenase (phytanoyl-CoA dioxygenase family)
MNAARMGVSAATDWTTDLARDGFAIVADVVDSVTVSGLIAALDSVEPDAAALRRAGNVYAMRNLLRKVPETRRLAASTSVRGLVRAVLGPNAFVVRGLWFDKSPEANWLVPWHQDLTIAVKGRVDAPGYGPWTRKAGVPHVQPPIAVLENMVTVRIHLDDSDLARGPLRVLPGSHLEGRLGVAATREWLTRVPPVSCLVPRGGAVVMRPLILHASSPAESPGRRRVVHLEFAASPLPGGVAWFESEG